MSLLTQLRQRIEATIDDELKPARERIRSASDSNDETEIAAVRQQLANIQAEIAALESASPAELVRRGMTAEKAVAKSDALSKSAGPLEEKERSLQAEISASRSSLAADFKLIRACLTPLNHETEILLTGEIGAQLCSMIDTSRLDVFHELDGGRFSQIWTATLAAIILEKRMFAIRHAAEDDAKLIAVLDEILQEPIPALVRNPVELPYNRNSRLVSTIEQILSK